MKKHLACAFLLVAAGLACQPAVAQTANWPTRPVKLIVGFAPGGPTDLFARLIAQSLSQQTGKNFFIENVPGAGGNVGAVRAAQSAPDGYTFLVTGGNITNNPFLFARTGYDPIKDFEPVTLGAQTPVVLAINPSVPAHSVKELVAWVRANPAKESYASPGTGTPPQLVGALFAQTEKLDLVHVPFSGGGTAVQATVGNHTPISFGAMAPAVPLIKAGQLRALAVTGKQRSPALPDVPTMAEAGFPEVEVSTWTAVMAPAHTPKDVVDKLRGMIVRALAASDVKQKLAAMAYVPIGSTPEECEAFLKSEMAKWGKVIKDAGLKAE
jgi:tripartite-type tricarboxylate transporter receptor subunit TctC